MAIGCPDCGHPITRCEGGQGQDRRVWNECSNCGWTSFRTVPKELRDEYFGSETDLLTPMKGSHMTAIDIGTEALAEGGGYFFIWRLGGKIAYAITYDLTVLATPEFAQRNLLRQGPKLKIVDPIPLVAGEVPGVSVHTNGPRTFGQHRMSPQYRLGRDPEFEAARGEDTRTIEQRLFAEMVFEERVRQDEKWGGPSHDDDHTASDWLAILSKHMNGLLGGLSEEVLVGSSVKELAMMPGDIVTEQLVTIAALCSAMAEAMLRTRSQQ